MLGHGQKSKNNDKINHCKKDLEEPEDNSRYQRPSIIIVYHPILKSQSKIYVYLSFK